MKAYIHIWFLVNKVKLQLDLLNVDLKKNVNYDFICVVGATLSFMC